MKSDIGSRESVIEEIVSPGIRERRDKHIPKVVALYKSVVAFETAEIGMRTIFARARNRKFADLFKPDGDFENFLSVLGIWLTYHGYTVVENPESLSETPHVKTRDFLQPGVDWLRHNGFDCHPDDFDGVELKNGPALKAQYRALERDLIRLGALDDMQAGMTQPFVPLGNIV